MTTATLQTPLEVILFFTSLASHGVQLQSFQTISDLLKADRDVRESEGFDEARLSPESLQRLFLALLKDEIRTSNEKRKSPTPTGQENGSPKSRKRKIPSPELSSIEDAQQHEHLIPVLVDKLYARYREQALQDILREEEAYKVTQEEILKLSQDGTKQQPNGDDPSKHKRTPSISSMLRDDSAAPAQASPSVSHPATGQASTEIRNTIPDQYQKSIPGAAVSGSTPPTGTPVSNPYRKPDVVGTSSKPSPSAGVPPYSRDTYSRPASATRPDASRSSLPPLSAQTTPAQGPTYATRPPEPILVPNTTTSRPQNQSPVVQMDPSSESPVILPPPSGAGRGYASPAVPGQTAQYRQGLQMQNQTQRQQQQQQPPHTIPRTSQYQQPGYQHSPRSGYPQHPQYPQHPHSYQGTPQQVTPYGAQPMYPQSAQQLQTHGQPVPYQQYASASGRSLPGTPGHPPLQARPPHMTPVSSVARRMLPRIDTSTPSTKWKSTGPKRDKSPVAPPLSPMDMGSPEYGLLPEEDTIKVASRKGGRPPNVRGTPNEAEDTPTRLSGRGRGRGGRGGRGGHAAASTRTRSQSVASQAEEPSATKKANNRKVLPEPGTPMDESSPGVPNSDAGTPVASGLARRRGNTLRSIETPTVAPRPGQKRKRANTLEVGSPASPGPTTPNFPALPTRPGYILGVRNMPRIAATLLNDVTTHKLASMFQKPISEREAPGYRDVVYQPQDLKTIRSQLQAGQKAIIAADAAAQDAPGDVGTPSGTTGASKATSTIWLERSADVMPPKAIVNSSQLETELCRIFANAVMFNPDSKRGVGPAFRTRAKRVEAQRQGKEFDEDEDDDGGGDDMSGGVVNDAREMFADVERQLAGWRAAERTSMGGGTMGLDGAADDDQPIDDTMEEDKDEIGDAEDGRSSRRKK